MPPKDMDKAATFSPAISLNDVLDSASGHCQKRVLEDGGMIPASKRSRGRDSIKPTTIDDLPDALLVEVVGRLAHIKAIFQCKLVSPHWRNVISDPYSAARFLRLQHDERQQSPIDNNNNIMVLSYKLPDARRKHFVTDNTFTATKSSVGFSFLPACFQDALSRDELDVVGIYNDLILCSPTTSYQSDYYICNPYTRDWVRLPPTPRVFKDLPVPVGFICEPYYNLKDVDDAPSSIIKLNHEFRFRVVRFIPKNHHQHNIMEDYYMEMFYSEIGKWREHPEIVMRRPHRGLVTFSRPVACNGKLYWFISDVHKGYLHGLDPFNVSSTGLTNIIFFQRDMFVECIGLQQGRLRICVLSSHRIPVIWELKQNNHQMGNPGKEEWSLVFHGWASILDTIFREPIIRNLLQTSKRLNIIGFHPAHWDILFVEVKGIHSNLPRLLVMYNVCENQLKIVAKIPVEFTIGVAEICPYVIPWWPTPIPKMK